MVAARKAWPFARRFGAPCAYAALIAGAFMAAGVPARAAAPPAPSSPAEAWVHFDRDHIGASGASGLADRKSGRAVTIDDPVRVASVSKLVVALGVMRLVEQGKLSLDVDVSRYLGWTLRNPAHPDSRITLAMLLSHTSSLQDDGEAYIIRLGDTMAGKLSLTCGAKAPPHIERIIHPSNFISYRISGSFAGCTARSPAMWDQSGTLPGSYFRYANINFGLVGTIIERVTQQRFDKAMDALVIQPLGLKACFNWGGRCTGTDAARAVTLTRPDGTVALDDLGGALPACPVYVKAGEDCDLSGYTPGTNGALFSPQGGLRISPRELAKIGQMLGADGRDAQGRAFLTPASIAQMHTPRWTYDGQNGDTEQGFYCTYGLATQIMGLATHPACRDRLPGMEGRWYGHAGDAYSLKSGLWVAAKSGKGMAYYATAVADETPKDGPCAFTLAEQRMAGQR